MKKFVPFIVGAFIFVNFIGLIYVTKTSAENMSYTALSNISVSQSGTSYSEAIETKKSTGFSAMLITVAGSGSVTITQQCSLDGVTFYDAVKYDGTAIGQVISSMLVGSKYVQFAPVLAPFLRFKVVEDGISTATVTLKPAYQYN